MTDQTNQPGQVIHSKPPRKRRILKIVAVVVAVVLLAAGVFALWKWWDSNRQEEAKKQEIIQQSGEVATKVIDSQTESRDAIYNIPPADNSPEQVFASLTVKSVAAQSAEDWPNTVRFAEEALAVSGYENDLGTLMRLDLAYEKTGQTAERRVVLEKLKAEIEKRGLTDSDEYRRIVEELK